VSLAKCLETASYYKDIQIISLMNYLTKPKKKYNSDDDDKVQYPDDPGYDPEDDDIMEPDQDTDDWGEDEPDY
jgi:hypothetical protein